jgi:hypothetical protein
LAKGVLRKGGMNQRGRDAVAFISRLTSAGGALAEVTGLLEETEWALIDSAQVD